MLGKIIVGCGILDAPSMEPTEHGINVMRAIEFINEKITIDKYTVMPNHVHLMIVVEGLSDGTTNAPISDHGASGKPRPTTNAVIPKLISSIKRYTNKQAGFDLWQKSFHDHIIRDEEDYNSHWQYIDENPAKWAEDEYYE